MKRQIRYLMVFLVAAALLSACSGDKKEKKSGEREKSARTALRVEEVRKRIDDLEHSLIQLYQEAEIQQMKIRAARENLAALRKSLGDLAKASRVLEETSVALVSAPIEIPKLKQEIAQKDTDKEKKKKRENRTLETLLLLAFLAFLGTVGYKLFQHKKTHEGGADEPSTDSGSYTIMKPSQESEPTQPSNEGTPTPSSEPLEEAEGEKPQEPETGGPAKE